MGCQLASGPNVWLLVGSLDTTFCLFGFRSWDGARLPSPQLSVSLVWRGRSRQWELSTAEGRPALKKLGFHLLMLLLYLFLHILLLLVMLFYLFHLLTLFRDLLDRLLLYLHHLLLLLLLFMQTNRGVLYKPRLSMRAKLVISYANGGAGSFRGKVCLKSRVHVLANGRYQLSQVR